MPRRKTKPKFDPVAALREYLLNRSMRERSDSEEKELRKQLMDYMEGTEEDVEFPDAGMEYVGYSKGKRTERLIRGVRRTTRTRRSLNHERAEEFLRAKGLYDECVRIEKIVDEPLIIAANYHGKVSDQELDALYDESHVYAIELVDD